MQFVTTGPDTQSWSVQREIEAHSGCFGPASVQFDTEGRRVATSKSWHTGIQSAWKVWDVATGVLSISFPHLSTHITTGELLHVFKPASFKACSVIFSHTDPDVLFGVSEHQTVRLNLADGSITDFIGRADSHFCRPGAVALNSESSVLYVGYTRAQFCVVAYDVETLQLLWKTNLDTPASSISYHDGLVFVAAQDAPFTVLSADDGSVVRTLAVVPGHAWSHSVFAGLQWHLLSMSSRALSCIQLMV